MTDKYPFNNCWWVNHPTINFFTFDVEVVIVFGHKCILEKYQDGEICSDDEYWGSVLYDFDNDRYVLLNTYNWTKKDIENLVNNYGWNGKISEDLINNEILDTDKGRLAVDFYKAYIAANTELNFEDYHKEFYELKENGTKRSNVHIE